MDTGHTIFEENYIIKIIITKTPCWQFWKKDKSFLQITPIEGVFVGKAESPNITTGSKNIIL